MTQFNAYHQWLGIPLAEQPPHHYRLLGIAPFEDDPLVIEHAADRQMSHLRTFQTGVHAMVSQTLLNEVAAARVCLLNAEKKAAYDAQLRQAATAPPAPPVAAAPVAAAPVATAPVDAELSRLFRKTEQDPSAVHARVAPLKRRRKTVRRVVVGIVLAGLAALGVFVWGEIVGTKTPHASDATDLPSRPIGPEPITPNPNPEPRPDPTAASPSPQTSLSRPSPVASPGGMEPPTAPAPPPTNVDQPRDLPTESPPEANDPSPPSGHPTSPLGSHEETREPKQTTAKRPPPSDEVCKRIAGEIARDYGFSKKKNRTPKEQIELAKELLEEGSQAKSDADKRFVLLRKAYELACDGGDKDLMARAVSALADEFAVDVLGERLDMLQTFAKAAKAARDADRIRFLITAAEPVLDQALREDRYDDAATLAEAVHKACDQTQGTGFRAWAERLWAKRLHDDIQRLRRQYQVVQHAAETLKAAPTDDDAHLVLGRWHCFERDEWSKGLPHLRDRSDPQLMKLAQRELDTPPATPNDQVELGNAWWDLARDRKTKAADKALFLRRAGHWYRAALPRVADSDKEKLNGRLEETPEPDSMAGGLRRVGLGDLLDKPNGPGTPGQKPRRGRTIKCRIFAAADNEFVMCVNGVEILRGGNWPKVFDEYYDFAEGDIITVRVNDQGGEKGFCCVIWPETRQYISTSLENWGSYQPQDGANWADPRQIQVVAVDVVKAADVTASKLVVEKLVSEKLVSENRHIQAMSIWGLSNPSYLVCPIPQGRR